MLAIPVLAGSAAYATGECFKWPASLSKRPGQPVGFYATIAIATAAGVGLSLLRINAIRALCWAAVLNGSFAAPLMAVIMHMASSPKVMGTFTIPRYLRVVGWVATMVMLGVSIAMFATSM